MSLWLAPTYRLILINTFRKKRSYERYENGRELKFEVMKEFRSRVKI